MFWRTHILHMAENARLKPLFLVFKTYNCIHRRLNVLFGSTMFAIKDMYNKLLKMIKTK